MQLHKQITLLIFLALAALLGGCGDDDDDKDSDTTNNTPQQGSFSISGIISVPDNTAIDSDVNDPDAPYQSNDLVADAQPIPNPIILGGYVNQPRAGEDGRSWRTGDIFDSFRVELSSGQTINLFVASDDLGRDDIDLILEDSSGLAIDSSTSTGATESLLSPNAGSYVVRVQAYQGASNYVLSIGIGQGIPGTRGMRLSDAFVPGELTVHFKKDNGFHVQSASSAANTLGMLVKAGAPSRRMLFKLDPNNGSAGSLHALANTNPALALRFATPEERLKYETLMAVKALRKRADVRSADPNYLFKASAIPNDSLYQHQWHYSSINLPQAWDISTGSSNVVAAVIDTGVLISHPDLQGKLTAGYDFISDPAISEDGDGIDSDPDDPGDDQSAGSSFHGTHVAGIIGARTNNKSGVAGIGWQTMVMPLRVLGKGGNGNDYDIEQAVRYAAGMPNDSGTVPARTADIINFSLGGPLISSGFQSLVDTVRAAGIIMAAASGNDGSNTITYPAALNGVISVGATDIAGNRATYSNFGATVDVAAPGGDNTSDMNGDGIPDGIISTVGDDQKGHIQFIYASSIGTSMATPHIAGVISLMKAVNSSLTPQIFDSLLASGKITEDLGPSGRDDDFGYGLINAYKAVLAAIDAKSGVLPQPSPRLAVTPGALNFGLRASLLTVTVSNAGTGSLRLVNITENSGGFAAVAGSSVDENGLGVYAITVARDQPGTYNAAVSFISTANTVSVPMIWQVSNSSVKGDAGNQFVLLVDADTEESLTQVMVKPLNGLYNFRFSDIPQGDYKIISGSDSNNDLIICDLGESCGAYLILSAPKTLTVNRSYSGVNFGVAFNTNFSSSTASASIPIRRNKTGFKRQPLRKLGITE